MPGPQTPGWHGVNSSWIPISSVIAQWEDKSGNQLPHEQLLLILAWAITIHKSQGLTLEDAVIDLGPKDFSSVICCNFSDQRIEGINILCPLWSMVRKQSQ